jgi:membrane fusion protein (multidrug efflux system)
VPERAVAQGPRGTFVYVVDDQGIARMRQVATGDTSGGRWLLLSGVSDGERVIVDGLAKVRPDSPVQVEEAKAATAQTPAQE